MSAMNKKYCIVCCKDTERIFFSFGDRCEECGYVSDGNLAQVVQERRKLLNLTRQEIADKIGIKKSTVYKYEKNWPSERYYEQTKKLVMETK